jgi:hypothetical protein
MDSAIFSHVILYFELSESAEGGVCAVRFQGPNLDWLFRVIPARAKAQHRKPIASIVAIAMNYGTPRASEECRSFYTASRPNLNLNIVFGLGHD